MPDVRGHTMCHSSVGGTTHTRRSAHECSVREYYKASLRTSCTMIMHYDHPFGDNRTMDCGVKRWTVATRTLHCKGSTYFRKTKRITRKIYVQPSFFLFSLHLGTKKEVFLIQEEDLTVSLRDDVGAKTWPLPAHCRHTPDTDRKTTAHFHGFPHAGDTRSPASPTHCPQQACPAHSIPELPNDSFVSW